MRPSVGRADLVRLLDALPPERAARAAALLGYHEREEPPPAPPPEPGPRRPVQAAPQVDDRPASMPFARVEVVEAIELPARKEVPRPGLTEDDRRSPGRSLFATPRARPLAPWPRLWPVLRAALQTAAPSGEPDVAALLRAWGRGEVVRRIPRMFRPSWSRRASIWVDRREPLVPFWSDQADVCGRLRRVYGRGDLDVRLLDGGGVALLRRFRPDPAVPLLVLGDLGMYGSPLERAAWLAMGRRMQAVRAPATALVPAPRARWDRAVAGAWNAVPWERGRVRPGEAARQEPSFREERAVRLLRLAAPAVLVQAGLLREIRALLPPWQADASTEADAWSHPDVRAADATGMMLHPDAMDRLRKEFALKVGAGMKAQVSAAIRRWHGGLPQELLRAETLVWQALAPEIDAPGELADAQAFADRLAETLRAEDTDPETREMVRRYGRKLVAGMPAAAYRNVPSLETVWAVSFEGVAGVRVPAGLDPADLYASLTPVEVDEPRPWAVRQVGRGLVLSPAPDRAWPSHETGPGSPVASILLARPHVLVKHAQDEAHVQLVAERELRIPLRPGESVELCTDASKAVIRWRPREPWAVAEGRDRFGLWADVEVKGVVQRFRWIPPGSFRMGSPKGEAGRYNDEGPQHRVTWAQGRWLADTPVTQALWQAVMGENPSRFRSPDRPVEQVSWEDCQQFVARINDMVPGLEARLPGEAEWEYACRAGTATATWLGDLEILGANNAPLLDAIAWYGGNCGVDYELKNGINTKSWREKQHLHTTGGTHPVRRKEPNPLGLHDMLGNVHEWCLDAWGGYSKADVIDPDPVPGDAGSNRVFRGGSWGSNARYVRSAYRYALAPGLRDDYLGFRLARGQEPSGQTEPATAGTRSVSATRRAGRGPGPAGRDNEKGRTRKP